MDIIKTSDFSFFFECVCVSKEGVRVTVLGGLALHACTSFITNRHNMVRTQAYSDKAKKKNKISIYNTFRHKWRRS